MDFHIETSAMAHTIRLGYEVEHENPGAGFEMPPDREIEWLAAWIINEGWHR